MSIVGLTHQWLYCAEVFDLVAAEVEMCEIGALICQNFQPSWDPVIAEFELLRKIINNNMQNLKTEVTGLFCVERHPPSWVYLASASVQLSSDQHLLYLETPAPQIHPLDPRSSLHLSDSCLAQVLWPENQINKSKSVSFLSGQKHQKCFNKRFYYN